jgi:hypothetical protein
MVALVVRFSSPIVFTGVDCVCPHVFHARQVRLDMSLTLFQVVHPLRSIARHHALSQQFRSLHGHHLFARAELSRVDERHRIAPSRVRAVETCDRLHASRRVGGLERGARARGDVSGDHDVVERGVVERAVAVTCARVSAVAIAPARALAPTR